MATLGEYPIVRYLSDSNIAMTVAKHVKVNLDEVRRGERRREREES